MATATRTKFIPAVTKTEVVIVTPEKPGGVTLELTDREATTLSAVLHFVGGSLSGYRGDCTAIADALADAGIKGWASPQASELRDNVPNMAKNRNAIYFQ